MIEDIIKRLQGKKILILGFGAEGKASYRFLAKYLPDPEIGIADQNKTIDLDKSIDIRNLKIHSGKDYLSCISEYNLIIKSPGIPDKLIKEKITSQEISSQTDLFLSGFSEQTIGVTGTKGKSTTVSLIYSILSFHNEDVLLVGNIGKPPFDEIEKINKNTKIVFELSSHQLQNISVAPKISVLLNLFEEHLDHYKDYESYQLAKLNISLFQKKGDYFICNIDNEIIRELIRKNKIKSQLLFYSLTNKNIKGCYLDDKNRIVINPLNKILDFSARKSLPGVHNLSNIMAAVLVSQILNVPEEVMVQVINQFKSLPHRLEFVGEFKGISFYNDSISTIPEATIEAIRTLNNVDTLILGGYDRGINYRPLAAYLMKSAIKNIIYIGEAGSHIFKLMNAEKPKRSHRHIIVNKFSEIESVIRSNTKPDSICLLSPAASSYDEFNSFTERGDAFKKIAENI